MANSRKRTSAGGTAARFMLSVFAVTVCLIGVIFLWSYRRDGPSENAVTINIVRGSSLTRVTELLEVKGLVRSGVSYHVFALAARILRLDRVIKAGEYTVPAQISIEKLLALLALGRANQHFVSIAEGLTSFQIVERLRKESLLSGEIDHIPVEGSLLPNTYAVSRGEPRTRLLERMTKAQTDALSEIWASRSTRLPLATPEEMVILASIVEKETGLSGERGTVAGVFINRIRKKMRLQSDPTIIYGLTLGKGSLGRGIRRSELRKPTPYNTYVIPSLPPTPIANPGRAAMEAVAHPEHTNALFFVADGTGGHTFSETLREHETNVQRWRLIERERKKRTRNNDIRK